MPRARWRPSLRSCRSCSSGSAKRFSSRLGSISRRTALSTPPSRHYSGARTTLTKMQVNDQSCMVWSLRMGVGDFDYNALEQSHGTMGPLLFWVYRFPDPLHRHSCILASFSLFVVFVFFVRTVCTYGCTYGCTYVWMDGCTGLFEDNP